MSTNLSSPFHSTPQESLNMAEKSIRCSFIVSILGLLLVFSLLFTPVDSLQESTASNNTFFTVSSFRYPTSQVGPYDWRYIRVDLPPWFSSVSIVLKSDVDLDTKYVEKLPKSLLPVICFRDGGPPLPDASANALKSVALRRLFNGSFEGTEGIAEQCYLLQKNITVTLTNEQISPGVWYVGLFNGIGATRTQGKMIVRSSAFSFSTNITVQGCTASTMWGLFCNQTINPLTCSQSENQTESTISCLGSQCHANGEAKVYSLDVPSIAEQLVVTASNTKPNMSNGSSIETALICYIRYGSMPSETLHDFSGDLSKGTLLINLPMVGRWYIITVPTNMSNQHGNNLDSVARVCYSVHARLFDCPVEKAGPACLWQKYNLQAVLRKGMSPFESYYMPISGTSSLDSGYDFPVEPISSNSSFRQGNDNSSWTYFLMDIPRGASGNIHVRLASDSTINYEVYIRFGGLPSLDSWDYYYANRTSSSAGSAFFMLYDSSEEKVDFYLLYAREGTWSIGLRQHNATLTNPGAQTRVSISLERCPKKCSSHGSCKYAFDASGLTSYSFCSCDRTHGGFDCGTEIVSRQGHLLQSIALVASNAAALLPAFWALRQKEYAEWILFTSSGISSGLYHACDVGAWCALQYSVLQFMDFWLSFMAVVSTFVYISTIDEAFKRTIHTAVAIFTALLALTKATRPANIVIVLAIGVLGLLIGIFVEFSSKFRSYCDSVGFSLSRLSGPWTLKEWFRISVETFKRRLRWEFVIAGLIAFTMAAISFGVETSESYWIWHSIWHVTIYTSSFFFLCSKVAPVNREDEVPPRENYELTRQDSFPRNQ